MEFVAFAETDVGRIRSINQDSYLVDEAQALFIVADGMGGHAGGEIASKLCVKEISEYIKNNIDEIKNERVDASEDSTVDHQTEVGEMLSRAINSASTQIYERALEDPSLKGMGTTATLLKIIGNTGFFAHVGDSRLYLFRAGYIYQLTNDHSLVSEQVRAGIISEEEAELHQLRNVITRSVGYQEQEDVDTSHIAIEKGDVYLLCSDGLYGKVDDTEIAAKMAEASKHAVHDLVNLANERGGEDNITALMVKIS